MVERSPEKAGVGGSTPSRGTINSTTYNPLTTESCHTLSQNLASLKFVSSIRPLAGSVGIDIARFESVKSYLSANHRAWSTEMTLWITRKNAAGALSLSVRKLEKLIAEGELEVRRCGRRVYVPTDALQEFAKRDHPNRETSVSAEVR